MFQGFDSRNTIKDRLDDRPPRPLPKQISSYADPPWLASRFDPKTANQKPSIRHLVAKSVANGIPIVGSLVLVGGIAAVAVNIFHLYH